jgi:hypothetical protein
MKVGIVSMSDIARSPGLVLGAEYYIDRCMHCGHQEDDTHHHQNNQCGSYKRVFVPTGTSYQNVALSSANQEPNNHPE